MKMASFFFVSLVLHAAALSYTVFFLTSPEKRLIPVVVLGLGNGHGGDLVGGSAAGDNQKQAAPRSYPSAVKGTKQAEGEAKETTGWKNQLAIPVSSVDVSEGIAVASANADAFGPLAISSSQTRAISGGPGEGGGSGNFGTDVGSGVGWGSGVAGSGFAQVSYAYNPKPEYSDRARREGWEGTVLLRVLVDEEGKSKSVEVNRSSGFESLDRAAAETVKRWRFSTARYGERPVESWVRIPIVFRLADLKN